MPSCWLAADAQAQSGVAADQPSIPLWQQGFSTWTGSGYQQPSMRAEQPARGAPTVTSPVSTLNAPYDTPMKVNPYTIPSDPTGRPNIGDAPQVEFEPSLTWRTELHANLAGDVTLNASESSEPESKQVPDATTEAGSARTAKETTAGSRPAAKKPAAKQEVVQELPAPKPTEELDSKPTISEQLKDGAAADQPPLQQEVTRWYQYPWRWMTQGWNNNAEFGLDGSSGNSETLAIQTGLELTRKTDHDTLGIDVDYRQASNRNVTTEDNGRFNIDYDRLVGDSRWSSFGKFGMEWDKFKNFDLRLNVHGGVGYYWIRDDQSSFATRFGAGAMRKIGAPLDDDWFAEALFGVDASRQLTNRQKIKARVDYYPTWEDFGNYRLVSDAAWEILLDGSENLSLRLAATDRYDSTPQGAKPNDVYYSLLLLYKF